MALILETNYSKKIGLPGFSSHKFSITLKSEITDPAQIQAESVRLYNLLQTSVDESLKQSGWLPEAKPSNGNGNGHPPANGNGNTNHWACSDKQRDLIQKILTENHLDQKQVEQLAVERFGHGLNRLNKLEASGLIDELFQKTWRQTLQPARPVPSGSRPMIATLDLEPVAPVAPSVADRVAELQKTVRASRLRAG